MKQLFMKHLLIISSSNICLLNELSGLFLTLKALKVNIISTKIHIVLNSLTFYHSFQNYIIVNGRFQSITMIRIKNKTKAIRTKFDMITTIIYI